MRLIVGLGNPGEKYEKTRHNIGFLVLEKIAKKRGVVFRLEPTYEARFAEMATPATPERSDGGRGELDNRLKLVEPQTFMNESGRAISKIKNYWKVDSEDIWVIHDDVDLELDKVRINLGGTSAGHKGIESIIQAIGDKFWRIRIGVGKPARQSPDGSRRLAGGSDQISTDEWVLKIFDDPKKVETIIDKVADFVLESLSNKIEEQTIVIN